MQKSCNGMPLEQVIEDRYGEARNAVEHLSDTALASEDNVFTMPSLNRSDYVSGSSFFPLT